MWKIVALVEVGKQREGIQRDRCEAARTPVTEVIKSWFQQGSRLQHVVPNYLCSYFQ